MTLALIFAAGFVANAVFMVLVELVAHRQVTLAVATGACSGFLFAGAMTWTVEAHSLAGWIVYGLAYGAAVWTALRIDPWIERRFGKASA